MPVQQRCDMQIKAPTRSLFSYNTFILEYVLGCLALQLSVLANVEPLVGKRVVHAAGRQLLIFQGRLVVERVSLAPCNTTAAAVVTRCCSTCVCAMFSMVW